MADETIQIDINDLDLGELEEFENIAGVPASSLANGISAKAMTALVYVSMKRTDPTATVEQARKVKLSAVKFGGEPDPTESTASAGGGG
jgi:hypothetical protein